MALPSLELQLAVASPADDGQDNMTANAFYPKITRSFLGYAEEKTDCLRTHYHFQILFNPDNSVTRGGFISAIEEMFRLGDDLIVTEDPSAEYLLSIPDKERNQAVIEFLKSPLSHNIGSISFTSVPADDEIPFVGSAAYDTWDYIATSHVLLQFSDLPLHLRTFQTVERMLQPYCLATGIEAQPSSSADRRFFQCFAWTDTPNNIPPCIAIKVRRRLGNAFNQSGQILLDRFVIHIRVTANPLHQQLCSFQPLPPMPAFNDELLEGGVPQCYLQNTEIDDGELAMLMKSLVLSQPAESLPLDLQKLVSALKQLLPKNECLSVHHIASNTFIVNCYNSQAFAALKSDLIRKYHITLAGQKMTAEAWSTTYGGTEVSMGRFVRLTMHDTVVGLLQKGVIQHVFSPFILTEDDYIEDVAPHDENQYSCFGWIDNANRIPEHLHIYIAPRRCQTDWFYEGGTYMPLYVRTAAITVGPA